MIMIKLLSLLFLLLFSVSVSGFSSEVVAQIKKEVITSRRIQIDIILEKFWESVDKNYREPSIQSQLFQQELDRYLVERAVFFESQSLNMVQALPKEIQTQKKSFLSHLKKSTPAFKEWEKLSPSDKELADLIQQKIAAQKMIEFKSRSSLVPVTNAEAFHYFKNNPKKFQDKEYVQVRDSLKVELAKEQAQQRLLDWYDILRKKYEVIKVVATGNP